ncbi:hypothetical protein [Microbacterium elymi]|uniref:Uncharacterized protein n=1 Tax=Microbacterium elymi TaxID=2909587 RepID=A0ABY5NK15_9MICO|nr:hypothetical protein [Microbacterium elymi]UUT35505.1 hypothetical protein L2X98_19250 [Microbacterium elymi]
MMDRDAAMKAGDWTAYGVADARLTDALNTLRAVRRQVAGARRRALSDSIPARGHAEADDVPRGGAVR